MQLIVKLILRSASNLEDITKNILRLQILEEFFKKEQDCVYLGEALTVPTANLRTMKQRSLDKNR